MNNTAISKMETGSPLISLQRGGLQAYVREINRLPLLTADRELLLARKFRAEGDLNAARQLVMSYLRLVPAVARSYAGYGLPQEDLIQEGNVGLMKAVRRFDPERGVRLASFALHWVRAEIHEFILRNVRLMRVATTKAQRKLFFRLRSMKEGPGPLGLGEISRIAKALAVKPEEVAEMEVRLGGRDISLEGADDEEDVNAPIAYLSHPMADPAATLEAKQQARLNAQALENALEALDARSRRIVEARWLGERKHSTLHELATELKVSAERVRQIESQAIRKMRDRMLVVDHTTSRLASVGNDSAAMCSA